MLLKSNISNYRFVLIMSTSMPTITMISKSFRFDLLLASAVHVLSLIQVISICSLIIHELKLLDSFTFDILEFGTLVHKPIQ